MRYTGLFIDGWCWENESKALLYGLMVEANVRKLPFARNPREQWAIRRDQQDCEIMKVLCP